MMETTTLSSGSAVRGSPSRLSLSIGFHGTVMISAERPAHKTHRVIETIIEHLTTFPDVPIKLEISAKVL